MFGLGMRQRTVKTGVMIQRKISLARREGWDMTDRKSAIAAEPESAKKSNATSFQRAPRMANTTAGSNQLTKNWAAPRGFIVILFMITRLVNVDRCTINQSYQHFNTNGNRYL